MTIEAQAWLPIDTRPPPGLEALLADVVAGWSARWFKGEGLSVGDLRREARGDLSWRGLDAGLMLGTAADTALRLGAAMLAVSAADRADADRTLLEEAAEACLLDLRERLAALAGVAPAAAWRPTVRAPGWCAAIGDPTAQLALALTDPLFATLVTRALPAPAALPLGSGARALAAAQVRVSAAVGGAALRVADLRALEIGDVVVLDRPLAEAVPIALDGRPLAHGTARVVAAEPPFLEIVQAARPA